MKLLRVTAQGLPLFKEKLDLSFYAQQRVAEEDKMNLYSLFSNVYLNPANVFIGINVSGKTSVLKVLLLALGIVNNEPINHMNTKDILGNTKDPATYTGSTSVKVYVTGNSENEQENRSEDEEEHLQDESTTNAKTGDESKAGIWIAILLSSMIVLSCGVKHKKDNSRCGNP